jgi:RNA polymerase sigma factor (TIGR02999 family)
MAEGSSPQVTVLLRAWREGDQAALDRLTPIVYSELHRIAHRYMTRERADHTLQTSALVNEAYIRLVDANQIDWKNRAHFFAVSSTLMRRILVDFARSHASQKKGGNVPKVELEEGLVPARHRVEDLLALDESLTALEAFDARKARVVELHFFGGLSPEETAEVIGVSPDTVFRDWRLAKAWLAKRMKGEGPA